MGVESSLRAVARPCGNLQRVVNPDTRYSNHTVNILDIAFHCARDPVGVVRDLTDCQGP